MSLVFLQTSVASTILHSLIFLSFLKADSSHTDQSSYRNHNKWLAILPFFPINNTHKNSNEQNKIVNSRQTLDATLFFTENERSNKKLFVVVSLLKMNDLSWKLLKMKNASLFKYSLTCVSKLYLYCVFLSFSFFLPFIYLYF